LKSPSPLPGLLRSRQHLLRTRRDQCLLITLHVVTPRAWFERGGGSSPLPNKKWFHLHIFRRKKRRKDEEEISSSAKNYGRLRHYLLIVTSQPRNRIFRDVVTFSFHFPSVNAYLGLVDACSLSSMPLHTQACVSLIVAVIAVIPWCSQGGGRGHEPPLPLMFDQTLTLRNYTSANHM
jgi:hypothetical protein